MRRDYEGINKMISDLASIGVQISKTKSRAELMKVLNEIQVLSKGPELYPN